MSATGPAAGGPDPLDPAPLPGFPRVGFLAAFAAGRANVEVGRYTYYDDAAGPARFFDDNVLYHYDFVGDRLVIGAFCAIATGVRFLMNGATHAMSGFSTYPFNIFGRGWEAGFDESTWAAENRGDTVVGPDVWLGHESLVLPGARIGAGAIIGARSVVSGEVRPYAVMAGNPAREVRRRFDDDTIQRLLALAWWDWPVERITRNLNQIRGCDIAALERAAEEGA